MEIAALVSGGVDSSVVVHQLKEMGYNPTIYYIKIGMEDKDGYIDCPSEEDIEIVSFIARKYGCRFEIVSLHEEYWDSVVRYTIDSVKRGLTPNPDMMCNKLIKFGVFEQKWGHQFDKIATGHYATTTERDGLTWLSTAKDRVKDQTYFLGQISYLQVSKLMFPIGGLLKSEVRAIATREKLPSAQRKDSQGICFLGKHQGFWFHTIGQRKGLGLSGGPWFVIKKDIQRNIVYVSKGYDTKYQYGELINLQGFEFITKDIWGDFEDEKEITFKIRHTPDFTPGRISRIGDIYRIHSSEPVQGIAAGQFGVVYDKERKLCLGSGMIY